MRNYLVSIMELCIATGLALLAIGSMILMLIIGEPNERG